MSKYNVKLDREQRDGLEQLIKSGQAPARKLMHARILLKADSTKDGPNWPDTRISEALEVSVPTIWRVRRRFVEQGLDETLNRRPQPERPNKRIFDGEKEAHLIALTCGEKPEGEGHWSMRLLADRLVKMGEVEQVSYETVRRVLKKTSSSRGSKSNGASPPKPMLTLWLTWKMCWPSIFARMTRAFRRCAWMRSVNSSWVTLASHCRWNQGIPSGRITSTSATGSATCFWPASPEPRKRYTQVTTQRTKVDWAHFIQHVVDVHYPQAEKIVLVLDNLNTHTPAALYEVFPPAEACRLVEKLEIRYTPKHGSWHEYWPRSNESRAEPASLKPTHRHAS